MKLSTRGRYGVRLMLDLALHHGNGPVLLKDISKRQGISQKYLWNLISALKTAGMVKSMRGAHGGFTLAKEPAEIVITEILRVLEGPLCLVDCVENPAVCERAPGCVARDIWCLASKSISQSLESVTLAKMVEGHRSKGTPVEYDI
jgi:Rrf2 family transcriptional regulator, cysteine metabolism repressor